MSKNFEMYKDALADHQYSDRIIDYIMGKAEQDADLTLAQYLKLCDIAAGRE